MRSIYLDYNATTPIAPTVREAMGPFFAEFYANPSSGHAQGRACREAIEDARSQVAVCLGCDCDELVFTSGGTESNNLAMLGVMLRSIPRLDGHLIISSLEHPSVSAPARYLDKLGLNVTVVPCSRAGVVSPDDVERALTDDTRLVSIMHANNEIGTIQPIRDIAEICHANDVLLHTDASQTMGKIRVNVDELDVDLLTVAGHKMYAPKGIGALFVRRGVSLEPCLHGAGHETGLRPGTENVPYIVGLGRAAKLVVKGLDETSDRLALLRDRLLDRLRQSIPDLLVHGAQGPRLPNTLSVAFPRVSAAEMLQRTPDLCASTGSACHSTAITMSPTLAALQLTPDEAYGTMRLSVGWYTSEEEVDRAANLLLDAWESLRRD